MKRKKGYVRPHDMMADCWREVIAQYDKAIAESTIEPWDPDNPTDVGPTAWTEHAGSHVSLMAREP